MRYLICGLIAMLAVGCNIQSDSIPATFTPLPVNEAQPTVASSDDCSLVSASGISVDIETQRANAPRTLPNGKPFPGKAPKNVNKSQNNQRPDNRVEVMIQFTPDSQPNQRNAYINDIGGTSRRQIDALDTYIVILRPNVQPDTLPESPIVIRAEINETATVAQVNTPNDPRYAEQWGLPIIGLPQAWENISNETVTIAVIDSGICAGHPDLAGRISAGYDFVDDDNDPTDTFGHGCGVAGVIAANSNNGVGIAGVAPNVTIMPLRVLDSSGIGNYANISAAIIYATDNGADIINLSLAGTTFSQIMADAVNYAVERGVTVVASAGNQASDGIFYPAAFPSVISVGSVDPDLNQSSFSNFGANVDIYAPGRDILTTSINGDYEFMSGTSFAAPMVAGLLAISDVSNTDLNSDDGIAFIYPPDTTLQCS